VVARAPGKVNLSLLLGRVREDGRHELVTAIESVSLADELTLTAIEGSSDVVICPGVSGANLVSDGLAALRRAGWDGPHVSIRIEKRVPVAAGMGGGSADAAAALRLASAVVPFPAGFDPVALARELGSDVPSQLVPGLTLGEGAGDEVVAVAPLAAHELVIVPMPDLPLSTADVYAEADRLSLARADAELERLRARLVEALGGSGERRLPDELLVNDLQRAAMSLCPTVIPALNAVREAGADHVFVSGSGPTVVGLFWGSAGRASAAAGALAERYPGAVPAIPVDADFGAPRMLE
jgi:4-diphosphocytidyl-2-C-methyl-D-erythritol kinase